MQNTAQDKLSIGQASEFLGVSVDTLRRWEKAGKIKTLRSPGGHRYFLKADLEGAFGQRYSRTSPAIEEVSKSTQLPQSEAALPVQEAPKTTQIHEPSTFVPPQPESPSPVLEPAPPTTTISEEAAPKEPILAPVSAQPTPQETPQTIESETPDTGSGKESAAPFEPLPSSYPQTAEKRYTVEEIATSTQPQEPLATDKPETYGQSMSDVDTSPSSDPEPVTQEQRFDEPLASFNTPATPLTQPIIQPSQAEVPEVTVTPQQKQGSSTLKKVSLFLLIVFMMVNIILIGFYVFVSRQL